MFRCMRPEGFRDEQVLFKRGDPHYKVLFKFMDMYAKEKGIQYSDVITPANEATAVQLHEAFMKIDVKNNKQSVLLVEAVASNFVMESQVGVIRGVEHRQPDNLPEIMRLFNDPNPVLVMEDTVYTPAKPEPIEIEWELSAEVPVLAKEDLPTKYDRVEDDTEDELDNLF